MYQSSNQSLAESFTSNSPRNREICNKSFTKNKWDLRRIVGDSSLNMMSNRDIYLCERGTYKNLKFLSLVKNKTSILKVFIKDFLTI